ncbi:hypothetical protein V495_00475 [Pseudogymnoascus sp. VKM F-4514 (FW-929)]|nr:hypothetical protein V495_00475 [Pseudogymnoascus sp. VKM F-4514 (FW-929)]KFY66422.1 hypothetical protein V497_00878 [Pseudogymnoascus sp. VKM F-4516 (FW-969)]
MSSQQKNIVHTSGNVITNADPSISFTLASLATVPLDPPHNPLATWAANVSRRDNPIPDFLFEFDVAERVTQKKLAQKKPTEKKLAQQKSTKKYPALKESTQKELKAK